MLNCHKKDVVLCSDSCNFLSLKFFLHSKTELELCVGTLSLSLISFLLMEFSFRNRKNNKKKLLFTQFVVVPVFDASTKYPDGLLTGHTRHFGDFDGCYNLKVKLPTGSYGYEESYQEEEEVTGRYCLVDLRYEKQGLPEVSKEEKLDLEFDPNVFAWEAIRVCKYTTCEQDDNRNNN